MPEPSLLNHILVSSWRATSKTRDGMLGRNHWICVYVRLFLIVVMAVAACSGFELRSHGAKHGHVCMRRTLTSCRRSDTAVCPQYDGKSSTAILSEEKNIDRDALIVKQAPLPRLHHADVTWKIRPMAGLSAMQLATWRVQAQLLRMQNRNATNTNCPRIEFPPGGQIVLETYLRNDNKRRLARFGVTSACGPPAGPIQQAAMELLRIQNETLRSAAIIYMFVEPEHRGRDLAALALEVIAYLHHIIGSTVTVLVADDNGSGKLVQWYERHGYMRAPMLQDFLGSPGEQYGVTMIGRTASTLPTLDCHIEWG